MINETITGLLTALKSNITIFLGVCIGLLAPIAPILLLVFVFIIADTVFGIWSSKKLKQPIKSRRLARFISKMLVYGAVVIITYAMDVLLLGEFLLMIVSIKLLATKVAAIALIVNEVFSIDEKLRNVNNKGIWDYFKRVIGIAKMIKKETDELTDDNKNKEI